MLSTVSSVSLELNSSCCTTVIGNSGFNALSGTMRCVTSNIILLLFGETHVAGRKVGGREGEYRGVKLYIVNVERAMAIVSFHLLNTINTNIVIAKVIGNFSFSSSRVKSKIVDRIIKNEPRLRSSSLIVRDETCQKKNTVARFISIRCISNIQRIIIAENYARGCVGI